MINKASKLLITIVTAGLCLLPGLTPQESFAQTSLPDLGDNSGVVWQKPHRLVQTVSNFFSLMIPP